MGCGILVLGSEGSCAFSPHFLGFIHWAPERARHHVGAAWSLASFQWAEDVNRGSSFSAFIEYLLCALS